MAKKAKRAPKKTHKIPYIRTMANTYGTKCRRIDNDGGEAHTYGKKMYYLCHYVMN